MREAFLFEKSVPPYNDPTTRDAALADSVEAIIAAEQQTWKATLTKGSGDGKQDGKQV